MKKSIAKARPRRLATKGEYKMFKSSVTFILLILFSSCSENENLVEPIDEINFNGDLKITTEKNEYIYGEDYKDWLSINGTLVNNSQDTFYSKLGDGFNSNLNQDQLFVAEGSDAYFETYDSVYSTWTNIPRGLLSEGTKVISILPTNTYKFTSHSRFDSTTHGMFRFLFKYYKKTGLTFSTDTLRDTSNVFYIQ